MPQLPLNLIKGDRHGSETDYRDYLPENMSGVVRPMFGAAGYMLQQPGLTQLGTGEGIDRRGTWNERFGMHLRVSGESLISVDKDGNSTVLGEIPGADTTSLPVSFNTQGIVADGRFYLYDPSNGFREVTDPELGNPTDCVWVNQVYFFTDGENIYHSDVGNESSIDPLKFATSEFSPDITLGVGKTSDNKVIVFNRYTIEFFVDRANPNFAYERVETRAIKAGIVGTHCKCEMLDRWFIMGGRKEEDVSIHVVGVGSVERVASREVDKVIGQYSETELSACVLEARVEEGYQYLIVHLPNETLLYNQKMAQQAGTEQAWSILKTGTGSDEWRGKFGVFEPRLGKWVYGDKIDSRMGILDETVATQYGKIAEWTLNTPFVYLESLSIDEMQIETIPGFTGSSDATVFVSLTYNGVTHGKEYTMQYGGPSAYGQRFIQYRFGYVTDWFSFKFRGASRSRMAMSRGYLNYG